MILWSLRFGWLVVLRIYVALAVLKPYRDFEGDNQSLKFIQVARRGIEHRSLVPQAKSLTTRTPLLPMKHQINLLNKYMLTGIDMFP